MNAYFSGPFIIFIFHVIKNCDFGSSRRNVVPGHPTAAGVLVEIIARRHACVPYCLSDKRSIANNSCLRKRISSRMSWPSATASSRLFSKTAMGSDCDNCCQKSDTEHHQKQPCCCYDNVASLIVKFGFSVTYYLLQIFNHHIGHFRNSYNRKRLQKNKSTSQDIFFSRLPNVLMFSDH